MSDNGKSKGFIVPIQKTRRCRTAHAQQPATTAGAVAILDKAFSGTQISVNLPNREIGMGHFWAFLGLRSRSTTTEIAKATTTIMSPFHMSSNAILFSKFLGKNPTINKNVATAPIAGKIFLRINSVSLHWCKSQNTTLSGAVYYQTPSFRTRKTTHRSASKGIVFLL